MGRRPVNRKVRGLKFQWFQGRKIQQVVLRRDALRIKQVQPRVEGEELRDPLVGNR